MNKESFNEKKKSYEKIHRKIGFWIFFISLIILIGIILFIWMF